MAQLNLITSNPVTEAYDRRTALANQQEAQDLQNAIAQQGYEFNAQANPIRLRDINSTAGINAVNADIAAKTQADKIAQSGLDTRKSQLGVQYDEATLQPRISSVQSGARADAANADVAVGTVAPRISLAGSQAQEGAANAQVAQGTVGSRISEAGSNAATAGANAQVAQSTVGARTTLANAQAALAQNSVEYDKEGRFLDLYTKNPQAALASADRYGAPPELVAALQDEQKAKWINDAWAAISAQYPGDQNAGLRASIFEQKIKEGQSAAGVPSASSALSVPEGSPKPLTRQDELKAMAQQLQLTPGSRDYAAFITSDGKTLPAQYLSPEETKAAGFPEGSVVSRDGKLVYNPKPGSQVSVNTGQEKGFDKKYGEQQGEAAAKLSGETADTAQVSLNAFDALTGALADYQASGGETGALAPITNKVTALMQSLNLSPEALGLPADAGPAQRIAALTNQMTLQARSTANGTGMPGAMSDADRDFLQAAVPGLGDTPSGIKGKITVSKMVAQRQLEAARMWQNYPDHTQDGWEKFRSEWSQHNAEHPLFSPAVQAAIRAGIDPTVPYDMPPGAFYAGQSKNGKRAFQLPGGELVEEP